MPKWGFGIVLFGLLAMLPLWTPPFLDTPGISFGATMAQFVMVAIIAIGLNVVVGQAGLLDLGYVGFYAVGAYTVALLTSPSSPWNQVGVNGFLHSDWAWLSCVPLAMAVTALAGLILGIPTLRLRGDYLAIVTLGFGEIIRLLADNLSDITNGSRGLDRIAYPRLLENPQRPNGVFSNGNAAGDMNYGTWWFWLGLILMVVILLFVGNLERSRVGRAWVAIREDEDAAEVMGVNTFKFKLWAFVIGAGIGGLSGALYAGQVQYVAPTNFNRARRTGDGRRPRLHRSWQGLETEGGDGRHGGLRRGQRTDALRARCAPGPLLHRVRGIHALRSGHSSTRGWTTGGSVYGFAS